MSIAAVMWALEQWKRPDITASERVVLMALADHHNKETNLCCPSQKLLAEECGLTDRGVRKQLASLEDKKVIKRTAVYQNNVQIGVQYTLAICAERGSGRVERGAERGSTRVERGAERGSARTLEPNELYKYNSNTVDPVFDEFWNVYPKRDGSNPRKPACQKFANAIKRGVDPQQIIAGARAYSLHCQSKQITGTAYVAQAVTWLNQERWNDEYSTAGDDFEARREAARRELAALRESAGH